MAQTISTFESEHSGLVHDVQFDYYAKKLATAGSDGNIFIFDNSTDEPKKIQEISKAHDGSIWQVSWAHPRFGTVLASCGFDRKVNIWKDFASNKWEKIYTYEGFTNSVNALAFSPNEYGLILLCGSSDGNIALLEYKNDQWFTLVKEAHKGGVNSVSWAPSINPTNNPNDDNSNGSLAPLRFVTCGCDSQVKVWTVNNNTTDISKGKLTTEELEGHDDWVRDVSWLNFPGYTTDIIASCGEDGNVFLWSKNSENKWGSRPIIKFDFPVWRVNWSQCGNYLAVTGGDNTTCVFKENIDLEWVRISAMNQDGAMENQDDQDN